MSSFNQHECLRCGRLCGGLYCYPCTCQQCGVGHTNGICLNCTYRDGKPLICCKCEGPLRGGFCWFCASRAETSFVNDPNPNSFDDSQNLSNYSPQPQYETYLCKLCGNDSHYGYDCPPQFPHEKQEVKNIVEQAHKHKTRLIKCLENFKVIHKKSSISLNNTSQISLVIEITPDLPTKEPEYSLSMGDEHLSTILEMESDKVIKSSVENLVSIPNFTSSDDKSLSNEDVPMENFKIYYNPLVNDGESISPKIDPHYFNVESNLIESLLNQDILIDSSPKFDYLLEEFSGKLAHINPIPSGMKEADFDLEEEIRLVENLLYDNSSPRAPEELNAEIADTIVESLFPSPIPVEDSDSQMEEIDLFLATDDLMPPGIENDDYDSEGDIHFLEELLSNDTLSLPENESSNFDHHDDLSFSRPPSEPPDVEVFFNFEPDTGVLTAKVAEGISEHYVLMPKVFPSQPTLCLNIDTLLPFSSDNEDKVFKPGILSYLLVFHREKTIFDFSDSPMMMYGGNIPLLDVLFLQFYPS
uniref:Uncharacterized protein n=1 Tax=Tanacetum cinerariifolium TaxID=118510 RepID=A0A699GLU9_TANCI|nr:hypothetical protein [Tanacetum cinerariifolium]